MKSLGTEVGSLARLAVLMGAGLFAGALPETASAAMATERASPSSAGEPGTLGRTTLYESNTVFSPVTFTTVEFVVPEAGFLDVTLTDLEFPARAGALSFTLVQKGTVIGLINGSGTLNLDVDGPQTLFGYVSGAGAPLISTASYFLNVSYAPIPLPATLWLLLGGLGLTGWIGRRRARVAPGPLEDDAAR